MARLIDSYFQMGYKCTNRVKIPIHADIECTKIRGYIDGERIAKPYRQVFIKRLIDGFKVIIGRYEAVYFHSDTENIQLSPFSHYELEKAYDKEKHLCIRAEYIGGEYYIDTSPKWYKNYHYILIDKSKI